MWIYGGPEFECLMVGIFLSMSNEPEDYSLPTLQCITSIVTVIHLVVWAMFFPAIVPQVVLCSLGLFGLILTKLVIGLFVYAILKVTLNVYSFRIGIHDMIPGFLI
jgi:hypothetical protein